MSDREIAWEHCEWARLTGGTAAAVVQSVGEALTGNISWADANRILTHVAGRLRCQREPTTERHRTTHNAHSLTVPPAVIEPAKLFRSVGPHNRLCGRCRNPRGGQPPPGWEYAEPLGVDAV